MNIGDFEKLFRSNFFTREQVNILRRLWQAMFVDPLLSGVVRIAGALLPATDNIYPLGSLTERWTEVFAANGVINTSDARLKTVRTLSAPEIDAAVAMSKEVRLFEWLAEHGQGKLHIGMTVQRAIQILEACHLDPSKYAFIVQDGERMGFNTHELAMFVAAGLNARLSRLEQAQ